jgi:hypothetical protein
MSGHRAATVMVVPMSMTKHARVLERVLSGTADASIRFDELRGLLVYLGFDERVRGSHHVFTKEGISEILNIQARRGQAKPYQVKQVRRVVLRYKLRGSHGD